MIKHKHLEDVPVFVAGDETFIREVLHPEREEGLGLPYSLAHASIEVGSASLPHVLTDSTEVYVVLEGQGTAFIDGQAFALRTGSVLLVPAGAEQYVHNDGDTPLRFYCIVSPPWNTEQEEIDPSITDK